MEQINDLLEKYDHFKDAQIRSIQTTSDDSKTVTLVVQDDDGEDINTVNIEFKDIKESRILQNSVLPFLDMVSGISIVKDHELYGFAIGSDTAMLHVHNAPLYIVASDIKIEEK
jgi:hypothetical protein